MKETYRKGKNHMKWCRIASIRKRGREPDIVFYATDLAEEDALDLESFFIAFFGRRKIEEGGILTNRVLEGSPYKRPSYRKPMSAETKAKIGANTKRCLTGRKQPPEMIENRRRALMGKTGRVHTAEQRAAQSAKLKGRSTGPCSDKSKALISAANSGENNGMYGVTHTVEARQKISEANRTQKRKYVEEFSTVLRESILTVEPKTQVALVNYLNSRDIKTRHGKTWKAESVSYVLRQCGIAFGNLAGN